MTNTSPHPPSAHRQAEPSSSNAAAAPAFKGIDETSLDNADTAAVADAAFRAMVDSVGVKRFSGDMNLSTRQVNRMLSGAQPNPVARLIHCLNCCAPEIGDHVLDLICQEMGGYFVREEAIDAAATSAVRECAEAIAGISDGHISRMDEVLIREAVASLIALAHTVKRTRQRTVRAYGPASPSASLPSSASALTSAGERQPSAPGRTSR